MTISRANLFLRPPRQRSVPDKHRIPMSQMLPAALGFLSIITIVLLLLATTSGPGLLSPQGCRMSYMSPSYVLQSAFDSSWTPFASRYSLWLYREVGWDSHQPLGTPVLFIPGHAGSSRQVRSIASSASRQYFQSPGVNSTEFTSNLKPLDVYTIDFNEDLSAFHASTMLAERSYALDAIRYISSQYQPHTQVLVLAHSMGGVVAISLLPSNNISAIITMSTPHTLPPARFDRRIEEIYRNNQVHLKTDPTPLVSLCGGAADLMIPSESCTLPHPASPSLYRSTLFTSALESCWTGVGHDSILWCHQVRWRVARAALELSGASSSEGRLNALATWLRDGHNLPKSSLSVFGFFSGLDIPSEIVAPGRRLVVTSPKFTSPRVYFLSYSRNQKFVLYVSQGSIRSISPYRPFPLNVEIFNCAGTGSSSPSFSPSHCTILPPSVLRLLPNSHVDQPFPVPEAGFDESEGVVLFEAHIASTGQESWIAIRLDGSDGRGWLSGGFIEPVHDIIVNASVATVMFSRAVVPLLPPKIMRTDAPLKTIIYFPHLLSSVLISYRVTPHFSEYQCSKNLLLPLLIHNSPPEAHYHRLISPSMDNFRPVVLHTHNSAPFISVDSQRGLNFTIYASGEQDGCFPDYIELQVDWWTTIGRWANRYWPAVAAWSIGIVFLMTWQSWRIMENQQIDMPSVTQSITNFSGHLLPYLIAGSFVVSFVPLPSNMWLGNVGEPIFTPLAPLIIIFCTGLVKASWWILSLLMSSSGFLRNFVEKILRPSNDIVMRPRKLRIVIISMALIFVLVLLLVPWQVAFMGSWIIHYHTCVISSQRLKSINTSPSPTTPSTPAAKDYTVSNHNASTHFLLLMTWLLPLAAPTLGVWVRSLAVAGWTTPFDGDHNVLYVAPFLLLTDWSWTCVRKLGRVRLLRRSRNQRLSAEWSLAMVALVIFLYGPRYNYLIFDFASPSIGLIFALRVGSRYTGL